jgi:hypothetical protein
MKNGYVIFVITDDMRTGYIFSAEKGDLAIVPSPIDAFKFPTDAAAEHLADRLSDDDLITYYEVHEISDVGLSAPSLGGFGINT